MMPKLLLADDSITVQRVIALTFQGEGIEVIAVGDGDQAVAAIDRERPQIVLADLSMPGRDGYAVAEHVKRSPELARDTRVVLLTGAAEPVEEARSRALGIDGVLSKPFEPQVATALVRRLLAEPPAAPGQSEAAAAASAPEAGAAASGATAPDTIAVDDYFRRLDEALATAGLATAPDNAGDLAAIQVPVVAAERGADAETLIVPAPAAARPADDAAVDESGPKLVDAFSALLAAEEGDGGAFVAGPVEMEGAPAPLPGPAVQWTTPGQAGAAAEAAAETLVVEAVVVDERVEAAPVAVAAPAPAEVEAGPEPEPEATVPAAAVAPAAEPAAVPAQTVAAASAAVAAQAAPAAPAEPRAASAPPASLRADVPDQGALDGIDLDVFADAVAQKILHRLTDARIDAIVSERVLEIAERLVREEIERIKADAQ
jgi:CheY-like chemotaxis protein